MNGFDHVFKDFDLGFRHTFLAKVAFLHGSEFCELLEEVVFIGGVLVGVLD